MKSWMSTVAATLAVALVAACANDVGDVASDAARADARAGADADSSDDAGVVDAGNHPGDAQLVDARAAGDASGLDAAAPDANVTCATCVASSPCRVATCVDGACLESPVTNGTTCPGDTSSVCVAGACVPRGCGDGYREPGPEPAREGCDDGNLEGGDACDVVCAPVRFAVAARAGEQDRPGGPRPALATDGRDEILVVWSASQGPRQYALMFRRYEASGVPRGAATVLREGFLDGWDAEVTVAGLAEGWVVAWSESAGDADGSAVMLAKVSADGGVAPPIVAHVDGSGDQRSPALLGWPAVGLRVVWTDDGAGPRRLEWRRFDDALMPSAVEQPLSTMGEPSQASVAGDANGWALVWTESSLGAGALVRLRRFDAADAPLDAVPVLVSELDGAGVALDGIEPAMAVARGVGYVIVWTTRRIDLRGDVRARRFAATRTSASSPSIIVSAVPDHRDAAAAIVASGGGFAVLVHGQSDVRLFQLDEAVSAATAVDAPPLAGNGHQRGASLTRAADHVWVVWADDGYFSTFADAALGFILPEVP